MTAFRDDIAGDFAHIVTSQELEELVTYYPRKGGPPRSIRALCEPDEELIDTEHGQERYNRLEVTLSRDALNQVLLHGTAAGHGGVVKPQKGDALVRTETDPERKRYVCTGRIIEEHPHACTVEFLCRRTTRAGSEHVMGQV